MVDQDRNLVGRRGGRIRCRKTGDAEFDAYLDIRAHLCLRESTRSHHPSPEQEVIDADIDIDSTKAPVYGSHPMTPHTIDACKFAKARPGEGRKQVITFFAEQERPDREGRSPGYAGRARNSHEERFLLLQFRGRAVVLAPVVRLPRIQANLRA